MQDPCRTHTGPPSSERRCSSIKFFKKREGIFCPVLVLKFFLAASSRKRAPMFSTQAPFFSEPFRLGRTFLIHALKSGMSWERAQILITRTFWKNSPGLILNISMFPCFQSSCVYHLIKSEARPKMRNVALYDHHFDFANFNWLTQDEK